MKLQFNVVRSGLLFIAFLAMCNFAMAQRMVKGKVTDADSGEGLIGASVAAVGTTRGTVTDIDGNYALDVPAGATQLRISYTGYAEQTITLGAANVVDVKLAGGTVLDEVVVVGYGSLKAKEVSSAVSSIKAEDFNKGFVNEPTQLLAGKVAGLTVARPGSDPNGTSSIRLRGLSTFGANTSPLVVIDGVIGGSLSSVDPADIESMDILKDGSASAIYGTRGSSGVILITTKKGASGKTAIDYQASVTADQLGRTVDVMTQEEYLAIGGANIGSSSDFLGEISQTGISHVHNLSMSGGIGSGNYRISANVRDVDGVLRNSGFNQINTRFSLTQKGLDNRLSFRLNGAYTTRKNQFGILDAFRYAALYNPSAPISAVDPNSAQAKKYGGYYELESFDYFNPVSMVEQSINEGQTNTFLANVNASYEIMSGLSLGAMYGMTRENINEGEYYRSTAYFRGQGRGFANIFDKLDESSLWNVTLNYTKAFGKNSLNLLGGVENQIFNYAETELNAGGFSTDSYSYHNIGTASDWAKGTGSARSDRQNYKLGSQFARAIFNLGGSYNVTASVRRDGASRFGSENRYGIFPAVSASANLSDLFTVRGVDNMKLRVGYGITGALPDRNYISQALIANYGRNFNYNGSWVPSVRPGNNPNPELKWEKKGEFNIGIDFSAMDYRLNGSVDYYSRSTTDLIYDAQAPVPHNYYNNTLQNFGELANSGFELVLSYAVTKNWKSSINASTFSTRIVSLLGNKAYQDITNLGAPGLNNTYLIRLEEDAPIGQIVGPEFSKIGDDGKWVFVDQDGDGKITPDDNVVIGNGLPKAVIGWSNNFKFGAVDLGVQLNSAIGHDLVNEYRVFYENFNAGEVARGNRVFTKYADTKLTEAPQFSSFYVENADFVRLTYLTVGYTVKLAPGSAFSSARFSLTGNNLLTLTGYSGIDPEVRFSDAGPVDNGNRVGTLNPLSPGIDRRSTYFTSRQYTLGVNLGF